MFIFLSVVYIVVCAFLILVVLLQAGKGGGMGAAFGGATQTVFGGAGAGNFLTRLTGISAAVFMLLSGTLAYMSASSDKSLERAAQVMREREAARAGSAAAKKTPTKAGAMSVAGDSGAGATDAGGGAAAEPAAPIEGEPAVPTAPAPAAAADVPPPAAEPAPAEAPLPAPAEAPPAAAPTKVRPRVVPGATGDTPPPPRRPRPAAPPPTDEAAAPAPAPAPPPAEPATP